MERLDTPPANLGENENFAAEPDLKSGAKSLPEACQVWYDAREMGGATERLGFAVPLAARADDGVRYDEGYSVRKADGTYNDLALDRVQQGDFLESLSEAVRQESSYGQLSWAGEAYHALTITVTDGMMPNLVSPFGGVLRLNLSGDCYVEVGGTGILAEGEGTLSAGNLNLWGWGGIHHPALILRGAEVTTGGFGMGCNSGETGTFEVSGGSFTCAGETWMQNAAVRISDGAVRFAGPCNLDGGDVVISGGTVWFEEGLWLGNGDITITGGTVYAPGGLEGLCAEAGAVRCEGGTVLEG